MVSDGEPSAYSRSGSAICELPLLKSLSRSFSSSTASLSLPSTSVIVTNLLLRNCPL